MKKDEIVREDFPAARKGWDPDAVKAHLNALAEKLPSDSVSLGDEAAERVGAIVGAAEATAAEIEAGAREQAEAIAAAARDEAAEIVERARTEAKGRLDQAQEAVESLLGQAEALRSKVGSAPEADPSESAPDPTADEAPGAAAEPRHKAEPEGLVEAEPEPKTGKEPEPEPVVAASTPASTDDLIAQLKGGAGSAPEAGSESESDGERAASEAASEADLAGARLVALNLAMEGADREAIAARLGSEFGAVDGVGAMLDDVLARAGRA
jgi:hypothetical protein